MGQECYRPSLLWAEKYRSFRSYSRTVRSLRPGSFRPDFRGESFRPSWGGSKMGRVGPIFKGG